MVNYLRKMWGKTEILLCRSKQEKLMGQLEEEKHRLDEGQLRNIQEMVRISIP